MRLSADQPKCRKGVPVFLAVAGLATAFAVARPAAAYADPVADHQQAVAALTDIQSAIIAIADGENATTSGPLSYKDVAQSAINAIVGAQDTAFNGAVANPGDEQGAIGHVNQLLDRDGTPPWVPDLHSVLVNSQAAASSLQDALAAKDLDDYEESASQALIDLEMAEGRSSEYDALGGMSGAIANTELAVTDGASVENGCVMPQHAGFGVYQGYLAFRAIPVSAISNAGIDNPGGSTIRRQGGMLLFYSAAAPIVKRLCASTHAAAVGAPSNVQTAVTVPPGGFRPAGLRHDSSGLLIEAADEPSGQAALYTKTQALAGAKVYSTNCASCHGAALQGVSAPAIAGKDFQKTAVADKYTVSIIRTIVTQNMPLSNPGSLSDTQYTDVLAYLLASNCYPDGSTPFPTQDTPALAALTMGAPAHPSGTPDSNGVCLVH